MLHRAVTSAATSSPASSVIGVLMCASSMGTSSSLPTRHQQQYMRAPFTTTRTLLAMRGARSAGRAMADGPDGGATNQTQSGNFDTSFEKLVNTITEKMPFQVAQGNAYDVQFGEEGYQTKVERSQKEGSNKGDPDGPKDKLRKRLTGEDVMTPESSGADRAQRAVKERRREKYDKSILKRSVEKEEFYYPEMTLLQKRIRGMAVLLANLGAGFLCYVIYVISFFDDTSCEPPTSILPDGVSGTHLSGEEHAKDYFPTTTGIRAVFSSHLDNSTFQSLWN